MIKKYLSLSKNKETEIYSLENNAIIEEGAEKCLYTQVLYNDDTQSMIKPLLAFAETYGYKLTGEVYGREYTNYFQSGKRLGLYRIYAPIK